MTSEDTREQLSALADGALSARDSDRLIAALSADEGLRASWRRYHLIGDVLRGEPVGRDVADRLRAAVAAEPTALAPRRVRARAMPRWLAPAAGLAAAASVGALAVLLVPRGQDGGGLTAAQTAAVPPLRLEIVRSDPIPARPALRAGNAAIENELQRYLTVHSDYAASGLKGPLPLAPLLVGHGAPR
jgi:sigma-E factor negative regulatory protein RseA